MRKLDTLHESIMSENIRDVNKYNRAFQQAEEYIKAGAQLIEDAAKVYDSAYMYDEAKEIRQKFKALWSRLQTQMSTAHGIAMDYYSYSESFKELQLTMDQAEKKASRLIRSAISQFEKAEKVLRPFEKKEAADSIRKFTYDVYHALDFL